MKYYPNVMSHFIQFLSLSKDKKKSCHKSQGTSALESTSRRIQDRESKTPESQKKGFSLGMEPEIICREVILQKEATKASQAMFTSPDKNITS